MTDSTATTLLILNGPNLNMLGMREPDIYGHRTLSDIEEACRMRTEKYGLSLDFRQSNHEGELVGWIQDAAVAKGAGAPMGVIINAAAYTHTSVAIHDALKLLAVPIIEVHLSNPSEREAFRHHSYIEPLARAVFSGEGLESYLKAIDYFSSRTVAV